MIGTMTLSVLAEQLGGELIGEDVEFSHVSSDTRTLINGELYLALTGERFDGNKFIEQAKACGASAAIVSKCIATDLPLLRIADTHHALGKIASINRQRSNAKIIAVTGSQGKTTIKEMIGSILSLCAETLITKSNLNNTIGVPLTLMQLEQQHGFAVIELGASRAGEIAYSADVTQPDIALISNASVAHIEGFGNLSGIVSAKGEIIDGLVDDGVLLLNADDAQVNEWIKRAADKRTVLFSFANENRTADYYSLNVKINGKGRVSFKLVTPIGERTIFVNMLGKHSVVNAVAAASAAIEAGANLDQVAKGLSDLMPVRGRLYPLPGVNGSSLIDDTYNASPSSFFVAIDALMLFSGRKVLIAGDMKELGDESNAAHAAVGEYAAAAGVDELWAVGEYSHLIVAAFGGMGKRFVDKNGLVQACKRVASTDIIFLVKGSRGARMDTVVNELTASEDH